MEGKRAGKRAMGSEWTRERGSDRAGSGEARRTGERAMGSEIARSEESEVAAELH